MPETGPTHPGNDTEGTDQHFNVPVCESVSRVPLAWEQGLPPSVMKLHTTRVGAGLMDAPVRLTGGGGRQHGMLGKSRGLKLDSCR